MALRIVTILKVLNVHCQNDFLDSLFEVENKSHRKFSSIISLKDRIPFEMMSKLFKILPDNKVDIFFILFAKSW